MATIKKYRAHAALTANTFVNFNTGRVAALADDELTDCIGVVLNAPTAQDEAAYVCVEGICQVKAGADITPGSSVMVDESSRAIAVTAGHIKLGLYLGEEVDGADTAVAANDLVSIYVYANKTTAVPAG
jgi:hypothetical protein